MLLYCIALRIVIALPTITIARVVALFNLINLWLLPLKARKSIIQIKQRRLRAITLQGAIESNTAILVN